MEMSGEQRIPAGRAEVWKALNDPEVLRRCIPGCQELISESETVMTAVALVKVGPISARFQGRVTLSDLDPPNGYRISGEGQGGVAGHAGGSAVVRLTDDDDGTLLTYTVSAQIGGKLAQLGGRMIDATARSMAAAFFRQFAAEIAGVDQNAARADQPKSAVKTPAFARDRNAFHATQAAPPARWSYMLAGLTIGAIVMFLLSSSRIGSQPDLPVVYVVLAALAGVLIGRLGMGQTTVIIEQSAATQD